MHPEQAVDGPESRVSGSGSSTGGAATGSRGDGWRTRAGRAARVDGITSARVSPSSVLLPLGVLAIWILLWDGIAVTRGNFSTPSAGDVLAAIPRVFGSSEAWVALGTSDISLLIGYVIAAVVGLPLGLLMARNRVADRVLMPYLEIAVVVPMAVMMPVVMIALGLTRTAQVVVIVLFALPFITAATRGGARTIPSSWTDMGKVFGASEGQTWRHILLPGSIATVVAGLRLGFAQALTGLVTVELILIALGIGRQLIIYQSHFQSADLFAFVGLLMLQSVVVMSGLSALEARVSRR